MEEVEEEDNNKKPEGGAGEGWGKGGGGGVGGGAGGVGGGRRKDGRKAGEEGGKGKGGWAACSAHNRAQMRYYFAENLEGRRTELTGRLAALSGDSEGASAEFDATIDRIFTYAAWADKWEGRVHHTPFRNVTLAMKEPIGVMGAVCPQAHPLLGFVSCIAPLIAVGNAVVALPSEVGPLLATDLYQVLDTSDVPGGVVNIVTGLRSEIVPTLESHDDVDGIWHFGGAEDARRTESASTGNMKRTWVSYGRARDWFDHEQGQGQEFLREATQVKNIWVPYGE